MKELFISLFLEDAIFTLKIYENNIYVVLSVVHWKKKI